jgi:hypothetical protein
MERYMIQRDLKGFWKIYDTERDQLLLLTTSKKVLVDFYRALTKK